MIFGDRRSPPVETVREVQIVVIVADCADGFEPGRIILFQLDETAGNVTNAARRGDVRVAPRVARCYVVAERVDPVGHRVAPVSDIEARGVVDVDAERIEHIAAAVADATRDIVAGIADRADATTGADAGVVGLDLIVFDPVAVHRGAPVEPVVVRLGVFVGNGAEVILGIRRIDRCAGDRRQRRRCRGRPAVLLADAVLVILEYAADLDLVTVGGTHGELHQAGGEFVAGVADFGAVTVLVVARGAIHRAAKHIDIGIGADAAEDRAEASGIVGAAGSGHVDAPALARAHDVVDVLGAERDQAADRTGAIDVGGRAAHHVDPAHQFWIQEERAVGVVSGTLIILPRTIDNDGDAAEILQTADVDDGRGIVAALLKRHAGYAVEDIRQPVRLQPLDLLHRYRAHRRQRIDRALLRLRSRHCDCIERLHRRAADLSHRVPYRRRSLLNLLRLALLALGLLLLFLLGRARDSLPFQRLRECCA